MSQSEAAAAIASIKQGFILNYVDSVCVGLLLYEYILTFGSNVSLFWRKKLSTAMPFFMIRFLMLFTILSNVASTSTNLSTCTASIGISMFIQFASMAAVAVISAMRVYAITGREWTQTALTFIIGMIPVGVNVYAAISSSIYYEDGICSYNVTTSSGDQLMFALLSRLSTIACDILVVVAIWVKTFGTLRANIRTPDMVVQAVIDMVPPERRDGVLHRDVTPEYRRHLFVLL